MRHYFQSGCAQAYKKPIETKALRQADLLTKAFRAGYSLPSILLKKRFDI
jgi:hypothetical protein